jgi:Type II intron maturase
MRREPPVRIREGLGVQFPRATRLLLGFAGPRDEAEAIKDQLKIFLTEQLKLELSPEKTLITNALTEKAQFLGYDISADGPTKHRKGRGNITLRIPIKKLKEKISRYTKDGKAIHRTELINESDLAIIERYGSAYRGIVQYYAYARNRWWLNHLRWVMEVSLLKTLVLLYRVHERRNLFPRNYLRFLPFLTPLTPTEFDATT